ncbi:MAG: Rdx family protein [Polyangiales bacterium]
MDVLIRYCAPCNYLPRAASLAATIREHTGADAVLEEGVGGVFEVIVDGRTVFSKQTEGRFPTESEILQTITVAG